MLRHALGTFSIAVDEGCDREGCDRGRCRRRGRTPWRGGPGVVWRDRPTYV